MQPTQLSFHSSRHYIDRERDYYYDEFQIPKKNGTTRRICAPSPALLARQRELLPDILLEFERDEFSASIQNIVHGFIPNRNCVTCAQQHIGYSTTIMMDISNFFDSVSMYVHNQIRHHPTECFHKNHTLAQGFATSPVIANLAIIPLVQDIRDGLRDLFGQDFAFTIYADDIQISINTEDYDLIDAVKLLVTEIFEASHFTIHPHKTRVRYARFGYRRMLGIAVGSDHLKPSRKLLRKMRAARHQGNGPSLGGLTTASRLLLPRKLRQ